MEDSIATTASTQERAPGGLAVYNEDEENLPPLKFEPGVVGAAQKGVSAVVIAFGACFPLLLASWVSSGGFLEAF